MKRPRWVAIVPPFALDSEGRLFDIDTENQLRQVPDPPPVDDVNEPPIVPVQGPGDAGNA